MQKSSSHRSGLAAWLTLLLVTAWSLQTMHGFLLHADHHERPVCAAEHDQTAQHIHDARYATDSCLFCALALSTPTFSPLPALFQSSGAKPAARMTLLYQPPCTRLLGEALLSRGPPAL